jgi:hypothetical protein
MLGDMSPEARRAYADRLEHELQDILDRRERWSGQRD